MLCMMNSCSCGWMSPLLLNLDDDDDNNPIESPAFSRLGNPVFHDNHFLIPAGSLFKAIPCGRPCMVS